MMKSSFLVCCLVLSVSAAPAPEAKPEPATKGGAAAKLQWAPEDAQQSFYSQSANLPEQQTVIRVAESPRNIFKSVAQSPLYVASPAAPRPYSNSRTTITTTGQAGQLPDGYVYEHNGESHIGHTSQAIHIKKQGALSYAIGAPSVSVTGLRVLPQAPQITSYAINSGSQAAGQIAIIDGRQAIQQKNGQWLWLNQAAPSSSSSWNSAWNSQSIPQYQTVSIAAPQPKNTLVYAQQQPQAVVYAQQQPQTVTIARSAPQPQTVVYAQEQPQTVVYAQEQPQTVTLVARQQPQTVRIAQAAPQPQAIVYAQEQPQTVTLVEQQQPQTVSIVQEQPALTLAAPAVQTLKTYTSGIARPAVDSKWYTKTNKAVIQPFYAQAPQYVEIAQASQSTKQLAAPKPESEDEKDW